MSIFKSLIKSCIFLTILNFFNTNLYCTDKKICEFTKDDLTKKSYLDADGNILSVLNDISIKTKYTHKGTVHSVELKLKRKKCTDLDKKRKKDFEYLEIDKIPKIFYDILQLDIDKLKKLKGEYNDKAELKKHLEEIEKNLQFIKIDKKNYILFLEDFRVYFKDKKNTIDAYYYLNDISLKYEPLDYQKDSSICDEKIYNLLKINNINKIEITKDEIIYVYTDFNEVFDKIEYSYEVTRAKSFNPKECGIITDEDQGILLKDFIDLNFKKSPFKCYLFKKKIFADSCIEVPEIYCSYHYIDAFMFIENNKFKIKVKFELHSFSSEGKASMYPKYYKNLFKKSILDLDLTCINCQSNIKSICELLKCNNFIEVINSIDLENLKSYYHIYRTLIESLNNFIKDKYDKVYSYLTKDLNIYDILKFKENDKEKYTSFKLDALIIDFLKDKIIVKFDNLINDFDNKTIKKYYIGDIFKNSIFYYDRINKKYVFVEKNSLSVNSFLSEKDLEVIKNRYNFQYELLNNFNNDIKSKFNEVEKDVENYFKDILKVIAEGIKANNENYKKFNFINKFDFTETISDYINYYCINNLFSNINSKTKNDLLELYNSFQNKEDFCTYIKSLIKKEKDISNEFYDYFKKKYLDDLCRDTKLKVLQALSPIFVDEVIKNEKENVIEKFSKDNITTYIKNLQNKKEEYNKQEGDHKKYKNIEQLLNNKNISECINEIKYEEEHKNKIIAELNKEIDKKLEDNKKTIINDFIESEKTKINAFKDLTELNNYLTNFNKDINEDNSLKNLLKQNLIGNNFKEGDIKNEDYESLGTLTTCINTKQTALKEEMEKQMDEDNKNKLKTIQGKINEIYDKIIKEIEEITKREDIKNYKYKDNDSITNHINEELAKIADYNTFIKQKIGKTDQTYEVSINTTIGTKVAEIKNKYNERNDILSIVNIKYTLSDEDKITDEGKLEFKKLTDEKYKKFDSRKTYKELFGTLKSVSAYFKNIDLVDSSTLIPIETKDEVIDKDNITINIKLVDSCYKKEKPKEEHEEDKNKDKHNEEDGKHKDDNENNGGNNGEIDESGDMQIKENNRGCKCCNYKNKTKNKNNKKKTKNKGCCKK